MPSSSKRRSALLRCTDATKQNSSPEDFARWRSRGGRELARARGDLELAEHGVVAIRAGVATLKTSPFTCRKAGQSPFLRELIIPFGHPGDAALFEMVDPTDVVVSAVRHPLEDDYH